MASGVWRKLGLVGEEGPGELGLVYRLLSILFRFLAVLLEIGTITFLAWAYDRWKSEPSVRVDLFFPSFFAVGAAILSDAYETVSLLFLTRKRPINPVVVLFDIAVAAVGVFCFVTISSSGFDVYRGVLFEVGEVRAIWAEDVNTSMILMMVFSLLHAAFILAAAIAGVYLVIIRKRAADEERVARNQAEMIHFSERQKRRMQARVVPV